MKKILVASVIALAVIVGSSSVNAASYNFTKYLSVGSTGADVSALQTWLVDNGFLKMPAGVAMGYFGQLTKAAVAAYQASVSLPSTGFVGPLTIAKLNAAPGSMVGGTSCPPGFTTSTVAGFGTVCVPSTGGSSNGSTGALEGTDGEIDDVDSLSQYSDEEVGESESDVKVLGIDVEASSDGDVLVKSIKVVFDASGNGANSDNLDDYIDGVSVWMGSTKVGSADVSDFNEDGDEWTKTVTLNKSAVIRADESQKFYVAVDGVSSFDSSDIDDDAWSVRVESIRYEDGSGVTTTDSSTGDLASDATDVEVDFVSFSASADTELKFSKDSSSPAAKTVMVDDENETEGVVLLVGKMRLDGTSDVVIDEFPVTFTVGGTATGLASTTGSVTLKIGDEEYSESVGSSFNDLTASVTFDNLDFTVEAGETVTFTVLADIESVDGTLTEGDTLTASVTASNRNVIDAENEEGDALTSSERTGVATGDTQTFRTEGIVATLVSTSADSNDSDSADTGTFTIRYKVKAFGDTVYIASLASSAVTYSVYDSAGVATTAGSITGTIKNQTDTTKTSVGNYELEDGTEETFLLTVTVPNGAGDADDQYYVALTGILWDLTDDTSPSTTYSSDLDEFQTDTVFLDNA